VTGCRIWVHVVSRSKDWLHCQSPSSATDTTFGAATLRNAAKASENVAITSARFLLDHCVPAIAVAPVRKSPRIAVGKPFVCDLVHNFAKEKGIRDLADELAA